MSEGDYEAARAHFLAAWRMVPDWSEAREGLLESLKARTWLYRLVQKTGLHISAVVVGRGRIPLWVLLTTFTGVFGVLLKIIRGAPELGHLLWPFFVGLCSILVLIQIADYVSTMRAWRDPDGPKVMTRAHAVGAALAGICMALALVSIGAFLSVNHFAALAGAIVFFLLAHPIEVASKCPTYTALAISASFVVLIGVSGLVSVGLMFARCKGVDFNEHIPAIVGWFYLVLVLGVMCSGMIAKLSGAIFPAALQFGETRGSASNRGCLSASDAKLRRLHPEIYGIRGLLHKWLYPGRGVTAHEAREVTRRRLEVGDGRAAVVLSVEPLLIAAYSDDMDCVAILRFDSWLTQTYGLKRGSRLLTVNTYDDTGPVARDLAEGDDSLQHWTNFHPLIAEFLTDETDKIAERKRAIDPEEWKRTAELGLAMMKQTGFRARDGRPLCAHAPAR